MPRSTYYMVQLFTREVNRLRPDPPLAFKSRDEAFRRVERDRKSKAGAMITAITGDPTADEWDEPEVLLKSGELPQAFTDED